MKIDFFFGLVIDFFLVVSNSIEVIILKILCYYFLGKILYDYKMLYIFYLFVL